MKDQCFCIILSFLPILAFAETESVKDLGFGFRREVHAEATHSSFESISHQEYLYFRDRKLSNVGLFSIAPSGKFCIYQDGPSGNLFLFRCVDQKVTQLTPKFIALARSFIWSEDKAGVETRFYDDFPSKTFPLQ